MAERLGIRGLEKAAGLAFIDLYDHRIPTILRFPHTCNRRVLGVLEKCGVTGLYSFGSVTIGERLVVLGKGHSSIVLLGERGSDVVAVKIRRCDSKHTSLQTEGVLHFEAWKAGVAPRIYCYDRDVIVMDYVEGIPLGLVANEPESVFKALDVARSLDAAGIEHLELSRPWRHVYILETRGVIIDYGSSRLGCCGNVPRVIGAILGKTGYKITGEFRDLLRYYKKTGHGYSVILENVKGILEDYGIGR